MAKDDVVPSPEARPATRTDDGKSPVVRPQQDEVAVADQPRHTRITPLRFSDWAML